MVREQLRHDPFCGTIFIFRSKRADRLKILAWDGSGLVLLWNQPSSYCTSFNSD
jgi:transposase